MKHTLPGLIVLIGVVWTLFAAVAVVSHNLRVADARLQAALVQPGVQP